MSLVSQISTALTRVGTEFKNVRADYGGKIGTLASLTTTAKTSLVDAINELDADIGAANGSTNLSQTSSPTGVTVLSDTGTDAVLPLADGTNAGLMAPAQVTRLADAVTNADASTAAMAFVLDEDDFLSNSATKVPTQQSVKAYADARVAALTTGAPALLDTLDELAAAIGDDANFASTTATALGNRVRIDTAAQGLTGTQQTNARTNIDVYSKAEIGDPETNFVTTFEAALV